MRNRCLSSGLLAAWLFGAAQPAATEPTTWETGDVFAAVGDGTYHVFDSAGRFKEALEDDSGGYTSDCAFSPSLDRLYTVNYTHTKIVVYDDAEEHGVLQTIDATQASPNGHSGAVALAADGSMFVSHPEGNNLVHRYDPSGGLTEAFGVAADGRRGANWIDLSSDQTTLFYTSNGRAVQRFDIASGTQLLDFAELPGEGHAEALRLLPPGDGGGGLLVADGADVKRLNSDGEVSRLYDAPRRDSWFAVNLDPDSRTFWATDHESDRVYRFDLASGAVLSSFRVGPGNTVFGVCVRGEPSAAIGTPDGRRPLTYSVDQNAPNPFNPTTSIAFRLPMEAHVKLAVYNLLGQRIRNLVDGSRAAGTHTAIWDGRDAAGREVSSGVYLYRFVSEGLVRTQSMVLLK